MMNREESKNHKMITREEFEKRVKRFIEAGYMKELYMNDFLAIYNFGDAVYLACPFFTDLNGNVFGMIFPPELIEEIINDNMVFLELYESSCKNGSIYKKVITLNDRNFNVCEEGIKYLRDFHKNKLINHKFDKKLIEYYNKSKEHKTIVVYKSRYGSTKAYAEWIGDALGCEVKDAKGVTLEQLMDYDTIIYGGGLYAEVINGARLITKNLDRLRGKKLIVYTTGITPLDCHAYYDKEVMEKNFKPGMLDQIKVFHFLGKMVVDELSFVHKAAIKSLKKIMQGKENPTEMEQLLIELCDADGDFSDPSSIHDLVAYAKA